MYADARANRTVTVNGARTRPDPTRVNDEVDYRRRIPPLVNAFIEKTHIYS